MPDSNSKTRADMLAARAAEQRSRTARFTPVSAKPRLSTRGEQGKPWATKRHTAHRMFPKDIDKAKAKRKADAIQRGYRLIESLYATAAEAR
ncbi:MAG: hypothetical protein KGR68_18670 [Betaproteobacteria bacterium]|nr:hypothetical protein [Betaproteobacteria bacterium]